ncbi:hypothetical protein [Budvicia aquatica]|uniref:hypothetical protein n=1 Tax=Budvicia aquatica TaxID=82979 RepID=UPI002086A7E8|nr:hypothetical protein [Budvicia aquatica]GKX50604.1 hypothetical protein SOASR029_09130 [Budvicia aquatica]
MGTIKSPSLMNRIYQGPYGNLSVHKTYVLLKAAAANSVVELSELPIGMELLGIRILTTGLGTGVKVTVKSGDKELVKDVDVSAALATTTPVLPYYVGKNESNEMLTATITGGAATGELNVLAEYSFVGY